MTQPQFSPDMQVDPLRVIGILRARLTEEIVKTSVLEAALQESQAREAGLARQLGDALGKD